MKEVKGGITSPKGFFASAAHSGIKSGNKHDLCLIYSLDTAAAAGVFTLNKVKGAPLIISKRNLSNGKAQAIIANSGNANCMTGKEGIKDADRIAKAVARALSIKEGDVLIASTGVIGKRLPLLKIMPAIEELVSGLSPAGSGNIAKALMTTDTYPKEMAVSFRMGPSVVNIGGVAKGAGMINPNMATMLAFITTDAAINSKMLKKALSESVQSSFNRITIDGDMSTNDCVFVLANGYAKNKTITSSGGGYEIFKKALSSVCLHLAEKIVRDAEGATKFIRVKVGKAKDIDDAKKAAYAIATSPLVKTAMYGEDPNWGRIAAAAGRSGADFMPDELDIYLGRVKVVSKGAPVNPNKKLLRKILKEKDIEISVFLNKKDGEFTVLTSDLSKRYIDINAHYTT